ncbi:helix-turn-helix domain-containing protein [Streptomyces tuirus]|uniref:Helix-turn-helix domain-containing protein n=1 Tax=Streptomyces tuirus TaxID=68278 RepID=A0A941F9G3_9ACTN|nr:helix-turn-helix domain-containing protein [Streptomyces tuirus]
MSRTCAIDDCSNQARPGRRICHKHRHRFARHGDPDFTEWTVADEYDVEIVVERAQSVEGLTRLERVMVGRGLSRRGMPAAEVARIVGVDPRTVYRWRAEDRSAA